MSDSTDPTKTRFRYPLWEDGNEIRACTPIAREKPTRSGSVLIGPLLDPAQLAREVTLQKELEKDRPKRFDVALFPAQHLPMKKMSGWHVLHPSRSIPTDDWSRRCLDLWLQHGDLDSLPDRLARRLRPDPPIWADPEARDAHLLVAFDLRMPLDAQLEEIKTELHQVQDYLLRLCGLSLPRPRRQQDTFWRDIYVFLLANLGGLNATEIARHAFPNESSEEASQKVRRILSEVRARLREASA